MRSIGQALIWEQYSRGKGSLLGFFVLGNALPVLLYSLMGRTGLNPNDPPMMLIHFTLLPLVLVQFGVGVLDARGSLSRLYSAPLSTSSLVAWHMFPGCILIWLEVAVAGWAYNTFFHAGWPIWGTALFAAATWAALQPLTCVAKNTFWVICLGGVPCIFLGAWLQSRYGALFSKPTHYWTEVTPIEVATMAGVIGIAYWMTVLGVARDRCGEGLPVLGVWTRCVRLWDAIWSTSTAEPPPFRSAAHAQFWYEWRHKGYTLPVLIAMVLVLVGIGFLLNVNDWQDLHLVNVRDLNEGLLACSGILSILGAAAGFMLGLSVFGSVQRQRELTLGDKISHSGAYEMGHFQASRPMTNPDFAKAIMRTAAQSLQLAWTIWAVAFVAFVLLSVFLHKTPESILPQKFSAWCLLLTLLGPWVTMTNVAVLGLSGRTNLMLLTCFGGIGLLLLYVIMMGLLKQFYSETLQEQVNQVCLVILSLAIVGGTVWAFAAAKRRALLGRNGMVMAGACGLTIAILSIALKPDDLFIAAYPMTFAFAALVVAPFATAPLAIAWNRHR